mgnify:CR=1 FL=1
MELQPPIIYNVKISFEVNLNDIDKIFKICNDINNNMKISYFKNFITITNRFIFFIHEKLDQTKKNGKSYSKCINITKIKNIENMKIAISHFCEMFDISEGSITNIKINNMTASGCLGKRIKLNYFYSNNILLKSNKFITIKYNISIFPGMFCKTKYGTILLFQSGKYSIVGVKSEEDMLKIYNIIISLI